jgi:RHS repeat-associated protein
VLIGESSTPQQTTYSYDFENRLNQLNYINIPYITGTQADNFTYNGEGLRTQAVRNTTTDNYLYDGSNVLVRRDGSGNTTKSYTRGLDFGGGIGSLINQNYTNSGTAVTQYYDYNDLGSVADTTTSSGAAASSYSYDAFGNLLTPQGSGDSNRYLFSTKEFDSRSGLEYFGARYYDPEIGRWLTPDPLGFVNGLNVYAYVNNNPVNLVDPFGLDETVLTGLPNGTQGTFTISGGGIGATSSFTFQTPFPQPTTLTPQSKISTTQPPIVTPMSAPSSDCGGKENAQDCDRSNNGDVFSASGDNNPNNLTPPFGPPSSWIPTVGTPWFPDNYDQNWINNAPKGGSFWDFIWWGVGQFFRVFHPH